MQLSEPREQLREVFLCDALAGVDDIDKQMVCLPVVARVDLDFSIPLSELERVLYEIDQDLLESAAIPDQLR